MALPKHNVHHVHLLIIEVLTVLHLNVNVKMATTLFLQLLFVQNVPSYAKPAHQNHYVHHVTLASIDNSLITANVCVKLGIMKILHAFHVAWLVVKNVNLHQELDKVAYYAIMMVTKELCWIIFGRAGVLLASIMMEMDLVLHVWAAVHHVLMVILAWHAVQLEIEFLIITLTPVYVWMDSIRQTLLYAKYAIHLAKPVHNLHRIVNRVLHIVLLPRLHPLILVSVTQAQFNLKFLVNAHLCVEMDTYK